MQNILHRLTVRKQVLSALNLLLAGLKIISREAGFIDCYLPMQVASPTPQDIVDLLAEFTQHITQTCASLGIQCRIISQTLTDDNMLHVGFTNDLMRYQGTRVAGESGFGSRGNNKAVRAMLGIPTFPEVEATPVNNIFPMGEPSNPASEAPASEAPASEAPASEAPVMTARDLYKLEKAKRQAAKKAAKSK